MDAHNRGIQADRDPPKCAIPPPQSAFHVLPAAGLPLPSPFSSGLAHNPNSSYAGPPAWLAAQAALAKAAAAKESVARGKRAASPPASPPLPEDAKRAKRAANAAARKAKQSPEDALLAKQKKYAAEALRRAAKKSAQTPAELAAARKIVADAQKVRRARAKAEEVARRAEAVAALFGGGLAEDGEEANGQPPQPGTADQAELEASLIQPGPLFNAALNATVNPLHYAALGIDPLTQRHSVGDFTYECTHCKALHWLGEKLAASPDKKPEFSCCG